MIGGYTYILRCANGSYYTGSTRHLSRRLQEHADGIGSKHTRRYAPVELLYYETYERIDWAYYREQQIKGWSRKKKEALMRGDYDALHELAICRIAAYRSDQWKKDDGDDGK